jgi:hypothetical protein
VVGEIGNGCVVGAVCLEKRLPGGGPAPAIWASAGIMTRLVSRGEEQGGGQAVRGKLIVAAVRDAFDDLVRSLRRS